MTYRPSAASALMHEVIAADATSARSSTPSNGVFRRPDRATKGRRRVKRRTQHTGASSAWWWRRRPSTRRSFSSPRARRSRATPRRRRERSATSSSSAPEYASPSARRRTKRSPSSRPRRRRDDRSWVIGLHVPLLAATGSRVSGAEGQRRAGRRRTPRVVFAGVLAVKSDEDVRALLAVTPATKLPGCGGYGFDAKLAAAIHRGIERDGSIGASRSVPTKSRALKFLRPVRVFFRDDASHRPRAWPRAPAARSAGRGLRPVRRPGDAARGREQIDRRAHVAGETRAHAGGGVRAARRPRGRRPGFRAARDARKRETGATRGCDGGTSGARPGRRVRRAPGRGGERIEGEEERRRVFSFGERKRRRLGFEPVAAMAAGPSATVALGAARRGAGAPPAIRTTSRSGAFPDEAFGEEEEAVAAAVAEAAKALVFAAAAGIHPNALVTRVSLVASKFHLRGGPDDRGPHHSRGVL